MFEALERELSPAPSSPPPTIAAAVPLTSERDRLVLEHRSRLEAIGTLTGADLQLATEHLLSLAKRIDTFSRPGAFDWAELWAGVGELGFITPQAEETTWMVETASCAAWLAGLDLATIKPFQLPSGREIRNPATYLAALRRDVGKGPGGPHAGQVAVDLRELAIALADGEASPAHLGILQAYTHQGTARDKEALRQLSTALVTAGGVR